MKLLFVCSQNKLRSPTAEAVFADVPGMEAIGCGTNHDAPTTISGDLVQWADIILVMEPGQRRKVATRFRAVLGDKKLVCLDVPDRFGYMQPELVTLLKSRVAAHVPLARS